MATVFGVKPEYFLASNFLTDVIMSFQWHRKCGSQEGFTRRDVWIYHLPRKRILYIQGIAGKSLSEMFVGTPVMQLMKKQSQ